MVHTIISVRERERRWSDGEREEIVVASFAPGVVVAEVARQFDVSTSLIYKWRREAQQPGPMFVPAVMVVEDKDSLVPEVSRMAMHRFSSTMPTAGAGRWHGLEKGSIGAGEPAAIGWVKLCGRLTQASKSSTKPGVSVL